MHPLFLILMLALAQTGPQVTVTTDRSSYAPGDQVQITVSASGLGNDTLSLWLYVDKPDLHNLYSAELPITGGVVDVLLPEDAVQGMYTVTVMWSHQEVETNFTVAVQTQTQTTTTMMFTTTATSTTTTTNTPPTLSTLMAPASDPSNLWPAFALMGFVTGFCVAVVVLAIAKRSRR